MPASAFVGLGIIAISQAGVLARIEPFWSWHTPIAWTGFIVFADGWIWKRRGESPLRNDRGGDVLSDADQHPVWIVFELYNKYALPELALTFPIVYPSQWLAAPVFSGSFFCSIPSTHGWVPNRCAVISEPGTSIA